ncbi:MAG: 30S ribosomal protein S20 [Verrucomicrobia bacterium]|nr:MAG: 30S ribosomal protein S20 [Verrucomicrobiota bacterium]
MTIVIAPASVHAHTVFDQAMANTRSAVKRARQTLKRSLHNRSVVTRLRSMQKRARSSATSSADQIRAVISAIDKAAKRGIVHRNAANRRKARLNRALVAASRK